MQRETVEIHNFNPDDPSTYPVTDRHCGVIIEDGYGKIHEFSGEFCKDRRDWLVAEEALVDGGVVEVWAINSVKQLEPWVAIGKTKSGIEVELFGTEWIQQVKWFYFPEI